MSMPTYAINIVVAQEIAGEIGTISQKISSALAELNNGARQNLAEWTMAARDAYNVAQQKWNAAASDMATQVAQAQNGLNAIIGQYHGGDAAGVRLWT